MSLHFTKGALIFLAGFAFSTLALAAASKPNGKAIFREQCVMCHGMNGKGYAAIHTPDFTDPKWQAAHPEAERLKALENGVKGTAMLSFKGKLTPAEMHAVLDYICSLGSKTKGNQSSAKKK
jgi:cytochrome c oxidase cbb3-type subunit 3